MGIGSVPITIRCDCGVAMPVAYGDTWTCSNCGRVWNTAQIPAEEYEGATRELRRYRVLIIAIVVLVLGIFVPLAIVVNPRYMIFMILILAAIFFFAVPVLRRRALRRMADRPTWTLRPE